MTREEAKKLLPFIQAYAEGKAVQWYDSDKWTDVDDSCWRTCVEYRIKPEPREVWVAVTESGGNGHVFHTERSAKDWVGKGNASHWRITKFREVTDE